MSTKSRCAKRIDCASLEQEGVIRFVAEHQPGPALSYLEYPELEHLAAIRNALFARGLIGINPEGIGYGNVSLRDVLSCDMLPPQKRSQDGALRKKALHDESSQDLFLKDKTSFFVSGTGTGGIEHLQAEHWCRVIRCDPARNHLSSSGPVAASSESLTHAAVYAADPQLRCVIHVHSAALFAQLQNSNALATPPEVPYGTPAMAAAVLACVHQEAARGRLFGLLVMSGHKDGVLAWGPDIATAYAHYL